MADQVLRKDHLFNAKTMGQLAQEYAQALPSFEADRFQVDVLAGFADRELMQRLEWIADCVEAQLPTGFSAMAEALEKAMPARLDPTRPDDDFGHFIHAVPGILAVRHGLEEHRARAMALLYQATKRFSMEFYIRPFLNRWPDETLAALHVWAEDDNYHVRRLVSEGTRPRLPWAKAVQIPSDHALPLLDKLHADPTRYVTRSVANHLNDISKTQPERVVETLHRWQSEARQERNELDWMARHSLRTLIKKGHPGALELLGFRADADVEASLQLQSKVAPMGAPLQFGCTLTAAHDTPVIVDYRLLFARPSGQMGEKVFKLKTATVKAGTPLALSKIHKLKADATTFTLHKGTHYLVLQVNGLDKAKAAFEIV
ncbi:MAG: hypothetical protein AB8B58_07335 [Roseobacter sp.]